VAGHPDTLRFVTEIVVSEHLPGAQRVRLRSAGFESCVVHCPSRKVDRSLQWFYRSAARASACAFVNELLANCYAAGRANLARAAGLRARGGVTVRDASPRE
jgi:hypothetical protein